MLLSQLLLRILVIVLLVIKMCYSYVLVTTEIDDGVIN